MAAPTAELERLSVSRALWHGGHPILRWNVSNVAVRQDPAGHIKPDRERSSERIDGILALVNVLGRMLLRSSDERVIYEDRGLLIIEACYGLISRRSFSFRSEKTAILYLSRHVVEV